VADTAIDGLAALEGFPRDHRVCCIQRGRFRKRESAEQPMPRVGCHESRARSPSASEVPVTTIGPPPADA